MKRILSAVLIYYLTISNALAVPVSVPLTDLEDFSGMSKSDILQKRQNAVETSPLIDLIGKNYIPNPNVFQIEDKAPWIGAYELSCHGEKGNNRISQGSSRESIGILNPELLFYASVLSYNFEEKNKGCSPVDYLIPYYVEYDADKKLITAYINYSAFYLKNRSFYNISLADANARDLGYNYVFADIVSHSRHRTLRRGLCPIFVDYIWDEAKNVTNSIIKTRGYYHLGTNVCQGLGGCNNYSPSQPEYDFHFFKLPFELRFKLWKDKPNSSEDEADIYYHLIFK